MEHRKRFGCMEGMHKPVDFVNVGFVKNTSAILKMLANSNNAAIQHYICVLVRQSAAKSALIHETYLHCRSIELNYTLLHKHGCKRDWHASDLSDICINICVKLDMAHE